ncbi:hypothetical protein [Roseomonas haemaphysalidis]|uniref:Uncharacterized protein n=1 Tax=Roseomonas haemaphysalidis TaxID=2768162 RepID=A0ABS3KS17_9PROT|nr:hypothetical protein [Roseomonas haemaphysalidis]MBO1079745.1 hypothetical protein [Roseomonas haemaphysalidis]
MAKDEKTSPKAAAGSVLSQAPDHKNKERRNSGRTGGIAPASRSAEGPAP